MSGIFTDEPVELAIEVSEMVSDATGIVTLDPTRVQALLADYGDDKPQFPILRVQAGAVSENGNNWPDSILTSVAEQINGNEKPGYWGHVPKEARGYLFPDIETVWLGATVKNEAGKPTLYVKGYNHPDSKARKHRSMARWTSWAGKASGRVVSGVRQIESFALESIDWARPGSNGMNAKVVAWATEMNDEGSENDVEWSKVTLADIETNNPSLFALMKQKVEADNAAAVSEMKGKADAGEAATGIIGKLRTLIGLGDKDADDKIVTTVTEMVEERDNRVSETITGKVRKVVEGKVKSEAARKAIVRLVPVSEMEGLSDDKLKEKVEGLFDSDDEIKEIVTEMDGDPLPLSGRGRSSDNGGKGQKQYAGMTARTTKV